MSNEQVSANEPAPDTTAQPEEEAGMIELALEGLRLGGPYFGPLLAALAVGACLCAKIKEPNK